AQWLMCVKIGEYSLWWLAFRFVPGASAIRVPARFAFVLNILVVVVLVVMVEQIASRIGGRGRYMVVALCGVVFLVEQLNVGPSHQIPRDKENALRSTIKAVPKHCKSFFVAYPPRSDRDFVSQQIDAMLIAREFNIPTLNGYSG